MKKAIKRFMHRYLLSIIAYGLLAALHLCVFFLLAGHAYSVRGYFAYGGEWVYLFAVPVFAMLLRGWRADNGKEM